MKFETIRKGDCPICGEAGRQNSNPCKRNTYNGTILCRSAAKDSSIGNHPHFTYIGESRCGTWARFGVKRDNNNFGSPKRPVRRKKREKGFAKKGATVPLAQRDEYYRKLFDVLALTPEHATHLKEERGLTEEQIEAGMFRSVKTFHKVGKQFFGLAGVLRNGALNTPVSGIIFPVTNKDGLITSAQIRRDDGSDGRYRWLTSKTINHPLDAAPHIDGEQPIREIPYQGKAKTIFMVEGVGFKPYITSLTFKAPVIGANGGNFITSKKQVEAALAAFSEQNGTKELTIPLDAGAVQNPRVMRQLEENYKFFVSLGYKVRFAWWGQVDKAVGRDIDELSAEWHKHISYLSLAQIIDLAIKHGGIILKELPRTIDYYSKKKQRSIIEITPEEEPELTKEQLWYKNKIAKAQSVLHGLYHPADFQANSEEKYLADILEVIKNQSFIALKAPKGSGKSHQVKLLKNYCCGYFEEVEQPDDSPVQLNLLGEPKPNLPKMVQVFHPGLGMKFLTFNPRIALGRAQSKDWGHIWIDDTQLEASADFGTKLTQKTALQEVREIGACADSIWKFLNRDWSNHLVVIDEIELFLAHILTSDTCKEKRSLILETFRKKLLELTQNGGILVIADADLSSATLEYFQELIGISPYLITHDYKGSPWDVDIYCGKKDKLQEEIAEYLEKKPDNNIAIPCSTKTDCQSIAEYLRAKFSHLNQSPYDIVTVHGDNSGTEFNRNFIEDINAGITKYKPKVLLYTSSLGVGCSIDVCHFHHVFGFYSGIIEPHQFRQLLARVRQPVPRSVWVPERANPKTYQKLYTPFEVRENLGATVGFNADIIEFIFGRKKNGEKFNLLVRKDALEFKKLFDKFIAAENWDNPNLDLYCKIVARRNFSFSQLALQLRHELIEAGHNINDKDYDEATQTGEEIKKFKEKIKRDDANRIAKATDISLEAANKLKRQAIKTPEEKAQIEKAFLRYELPGLELTPDVVYDLKNKDGGEYLKRIKRDLLSANEEMLRDKEVKLAKKRLDAVQGAEKPFLPDFRSNCPIVRLLNDFGIRKFIDDEIEFHRNCSEVQTFLQAALTKKQQLRKLLQITVKPDSDPIKLLERCLNFFGHSKKLVSIMQNDGKKTRSYQVDQFYKCDPLRQSIVQALLRRHNQNHSKPQADCATAKTLTYHSFKEDYQSVFRGDNVQNQEKLPDPLTTVVPKLADIPSEYRSDEALTDIASWLKACRTKEMLAELLECKIPRLVFTFAARLLPKDIRAKLRSWLQTLRTAPKSPFGGTATTY